MGNEITWQDLIDSTEALIILKYWRPGLTYKPNTRHLKKFIDQGDLTTRIKIKNQWLYSRKECEALFLKIITSKTTK